MNEEVSAVQKVVEQLLTKIGIEATVQTAADPEGDFAIQIDSPEAASLIGFHGETLQSIQLVSSFLVHQDLGRWAKVAVNVGDYRQKREEQLCRLADSLANKVAISGEVQIIPNLTAAERRIVHLFLSENPAVVSESEGDGRDRVLTIKPRPAPAV